MCGIAGEVSLFGVSSETSVANMIAEMLSRGPDAQKIHTMGSVTFGHARLSIIDLNEISNQPFLDSTGRYMVVFNGEIYNYKHIRSQLQAQNVIFRTTGDTEVLIEAYKRWGNKCLAMLNGMFAFAIWDNVDKCLIIARDRFGEKPVYYGFDGKTFIFASTLKGMTAHHKIKSSLDMVALRQYLALNYTTTEKCILKNIYKLEPASFLTLNAEGNISISRYWNYVDFFKNKIEVKNPNALYEEIYELIKDSVNLRMVSDVPVCTFLSGGIDSSLIVKALSERYKHVETFTLAFNNPKFDESIYAQNLANYLNLKNHKISSCNRVAESFKAMVSYLDEPFADSSFIPAADLSLGSSKFFKVALSGDGGDEIFAGYETYNADILLRYLELLPSNINRFLNVIFNNLVPHSFGKVGMDEKVRRLLDGCGNGNVFGHYHWRIIFKDSELLNLFNPDFYHLINNDSPFGIYERFYQEARDLDLIDQSLYVDSKTWLVDDILFKSDRASMMHSQEVRSPLLDHRIAEKMAQIPVKEKMRLFELKKVLKGILNSKVPSQFIQTKKLGFNAPLVNWLRGPLLDFYYDAINDSRFTSVFNARYLQTLMNETVSGKKDNGYKLYGILVLFSWIRENKISM